MYFVGIDPGLKGALVKLDQNCKLVDYILMTEMTNPKIFINFCKDASVVTLEKAKGYPGEGVRSVFTYGNGFGYLRGAMAFSIHRAEERGEKPFHPVIVTPQEWHLYFKKRIPTQLLKKQASHFWAQHLWPEQNFIPKRCKKPHMGVVDAAMLAAYGFYAIGGLWTANLMFKVSLPNPVLPATFKDLSRVKRRNQAS